MTNCAMKIGTSLPRNVLLKVLGDSLSLRLLSRLFHNDTVQGHPTRI